MEFALYINNIEDFDRIAKKYILNLNKTIKTNKYLQKLNQIDEVFFSRLYFGSEFCERLIPTVNELKRIINFCNKHYLNSTLLTPYVTDISMKKLKELFKFLNKTEMKNIEIVFNDWGVFYYLKNNYDFDLSAGRLLTKQKKEPSFIENLVDKKFLNLDKYTKLIIKQSAIDATSQFKGFVLKNKISRIELDNVYQGIEINFDIKKSLYYPFIPVTTTRFCKVHSYYLKKAYIRGKNSCNRECLKTSYYRYTVNNVHLFLKGNTQFYCNNILPKNVNIFDRIVFEPVDVIK